MKYLLKEKSFRQYGLFLLRIRNKTKEAKENFEKAVDIYPTSETLLELARILSSDHFRDITKAEECYVKSIELNPSNFDASYEYSLLLRDHFHDYKKSKKVE